MKTIAGALAGVFVGAVIVEIVRRRNPKLIADIEQKAKITVDTLVGAFRDGYRRNPEVEPSKT